MTSSANESNAANGDEERMKDTDNGHISDLQKHHKLLQERYSLVTSAGGVGLWDWDLKTHAIYLDPILKRMLGYDDDEVKNHLDDWGRLIHADDAVLVKEALEQYISGSKPRYELEHRMVHRDGSIRWFFARGTVLRNAKGEPYRMVGTSTDITNLKDLQRILIKYRKHVHNLTDVAATLYSTQTEDDIFKTVLEAASQMFDATIIDIAVHEDGKLIPQLNSEGITGNTPATDLSDDFALHVFKTGQTRFFGREADYDEFGIARQGFRSGILLPFGNFGILQIYSVVPDAFDEDDARALELLSIELTQSLQRVRLYIEMSQNLQLDPLTGTLSRQQLPDLLSREIKRSDRSKRAIGFILIDVDGFKEINESKGYQIADRILKYVADVILTQARATDFVVRYSGDSFLVVLPETNDGAESLLSRIEGSMEGNTQLEQLLGVPINISAGTSYWRSDKPETIDDVILDAEAQLCQNRRLKEGDSQPQIPESSDTPIL